MILQIIIDILPRYDRMSVLVAVSDDPDSLSRTRNLDRVRAKFFIEILALIMRIHIQNTIRDHERHSIQQEEEGQRMRLDC